MNTTFLWLIFLIASLLIEILSSPGLFFFLAFSFGAGAAALASWYGVSIVFQCLVFLALSAVSFILLRSIMKRISKDTMHQSNVYALQGKKAIVTETISSCKRGWVKVENELWAAAPVDDELIHKGEMVEVISNAGSHLKVKKIKGQC